MCQVVFDGGECFVTFSISALMLCAALLAHIARNCGDHHDSSLEALPSNVSIGHTFEGLDFTLVTVSLCDENVS